MKTPLILIIFGLISSNLLGQNQQIDTLEIKTAIDSSFLKLEIEGFYGKSKYRSIDNTGFYYGKCITITFENISDSILIIKMPVGSILKCRDTTVQDMIVTKSFVLNLYPKYKVGYLIYAMCGEISDAGPSKGKFYDYGGLADPEVVRTAQLIQEKNIQDNIGQFTMWVVRNNADSAKLKRYGASDSNLQKIVNYLAELSIERKLTSQINPASEEPIIQSVTKNEQENHEKTNEFEVNTLTYILSIACGVLLVIIVTFLIRKKKNNIT